MKTEEQLKPSGFQRPPTLLVVLAFLGFISIGLPDAAIGIAWPSVRDVYSVRQQALGLVLLASGLGYLLSSFGYGRISQVSGIGLVLTVSTAMVSVAMFGFGLAPLWGIFLLCGALHGLGSGAIDSGLNAYAARHFPTRYLMWLHACYCAGAMMGPIIMTAVFASGQSYQQGYFILGLSMAVMALLFLATQKQWGREAASTSTAHSSGGFFTALANVRILWQMLVFFLYTGLEVACSQWTFSILTESRQVSPVLASSAVALFWAGLLCGRLVLGVVVDRLGTDRLIRLSLLCAVAGGILFAIPALPVGVTIAGLVLTGFGLAPAFPCLVARTPARVGNELSSPAIGLQIGAAMIGAAAVPGTLGMIAGQWGIALIAPGISLLLGVLFLLHEVLLRFPDVTPGEA